MNGMEIYCGHKTYFYPTESTRRTSYIARKVATAILRHNGSTEEPTNATVQFVKDNMQVAQLDYHTLLNGDKWVCIHNDTSSYNAPADDPTTVILEEVAQ